MKACPNCRCLWADEYGGQCTDCGAPMSGVQANSSSSGGAGGDLAFRYANQLASGRREADMEQALKHGSATSFRIGEKGNIPIHENVLGKALEMLGEPKPDSKLAQEAA